MISFIRLNSFGFLVTISVTNGNWQTFPLFAYHIFRIPHLLLLMRFTLMKANKLKGETPFKWGFSWLSVYYTSSRCSSAKDLRKSAVGCWHTRLRLDVPQHQRCAAMCTHSYFISPFFLRINILIARRFRLLPVIKLTKHKIYWMGLRNEFFSMFLLLILLVRDIFWIELVETSRSTAFKRNKNDWFLRMQWMAQWLCLHQSVMQSSCVALSTRINWIDRRNY